MHTAAFYTSGIIGRNQEANVVPGQEFQSMRKVLWLWIHPQPDSVLRFESIFLANRWLIFPTARFQHAFKDIPGSTESSFKAKRQEQFQVKCWMSSSSPLLKKADARCLKATCTALKTSCTPWVYPWSKLLHGSVGGHPQPSSYSFERLAGVSATKSVWISAGGTRGTVSENRRTSPSEVALTRLFLQGCQQSSATDAAVSAVAFCDIWKWTSIVVLRNGARSLLFE